MFKTAVEIFGWLWLFVAINVALWSAGIGWFLALTGNLTTLGAAILLGFELEEIYSQEYGKKDDEIKFGQF